MTRPSGPAGVSRRGFAAASLGLTGLTVPGCRRGPDIHTRDPDIGKADQPATQAVIVDIRAGQTDALHERLRGHVFERAVAGVHFARFTIMPEDRLLFSLVYDDPGDPLELLARNARTVDPLLSLCEGWPAAGAEDRAALGRWLTAHEHPILLLYSAFSRGSEPAIRESVALRDDYLRLVKTVTRAPERVEAEYQAFIRANQARMDAQEQGGPHLSPYRLVDPDEQNPFLMVFTMRPGELPRLREQLELGTWAIDHLHIHPLREIPTVHYARFAELANDRVLFASVYDGEWEQYVEDFATRIPRKLDDVWGGAVGYPPGGAADAPALAAFLEEHRIPRDFFYAAEKRRTVKEIQASLALGEELVRWSRDEPRGAAALRDRIERFTHEHQRLLA